MGHNHIYGFARWRLWNKAPQLPPSPLKRGRRRIICKKKSYTFQSFPLFKVQKKIWFQPPLKACHYPPTQHKTRSRTIWSKLSAGSYLSLGRAHKAHNHQCNNQLNQQCNNQHNQQCKRLKWRGSDTGGWEFFGESHVRTDNGKLNISSKDRQTDRQTDISGLKKTANGKHFLPNFLGSKFI